MINQGMINLQEKLAVISDVHSNSYALSAVLEDIGNYDIDLIINLGDSLYGPIDPYGTFQMLNKSNILSIAGNQDREILDCIHKPSANPTLEFVKNELTLDAFAWLKGLPFDQVINGDIYCCHGTPQNDEEYLLEKVEPDHVAFRESKDITNKLSGLKQRTILCGHSHVPNSITIGDKLIVNAGSVGLQAYDDELPLYHIMQNNSPHARYVILTRDENQYSAEIRSVDYDIESAATQSGKNGREDWVRWLRTGMA